MNVKELKERLLSLGWVDKGDVLVRYSNPRLGWKPADGTLIVGYFEWPKKVRDIDTIQNILKLYTDERIME